MDPLSIAAGCLSLANTITKASVTIYGFIKSVRAARGDLDAISRELLSLKTLLELLADDATDSYCYAFPKTLERQVNGIVSNCNEVVQSIEKTLKDYETLEGFKAAKWTVSAKDDMNKLRLSLEAHKSALEIALDMAAL
jgi:hypothetical protein